jgi:hypothetical protein
VTWTDWLIALHILGAFALMGGMTLFWTLVLATRPPAAGLSSESVNALARPAGAAVGVGAVATLIFGIWLAIDIDGYAVWDGWILAAIVLWAVGGALGQRAGVTFQRLSESGVDAGATWRMGTRLHAGSTIAYLLVLALMIFKPGA